MNNNKKSGVSYRKPKTSLTQGGNDIAPGQLVKQAIAKTGEKNIRSYARKVVEFVLGCLTIKDCSPEKKHGLVCRGFSNVKLLKQTKDAHKKGIIVQQTIGKEVFFTIGK